MSKISTIVKTQVRFSEVDSIKMVWHGHYVKYLEDAREAFGREHGLEYLYMFNCGYLAPMFDLHLNYKQPATIDDVLLITITYHHCKGSKLMFDYRVERESDMAEILTATSIQLFTNLEGKLEPSCPDFLEKWRLEHNL